MYAYEAGNGYAEVSAPSIIQEILLENPEFCNSCGLRGDHSERVLLEISGFEVLQEVGY